VVPLKKRINDGCDFTAFPGVASAQNEKSPENRGFFAHGREMPGFKDF
jgi:hypothetical protein